MGSAPPFNDTGVELRLGWKAYDSQLFLVVAVFLLPLAVGFGAAFGTEEWVPDQNLTLALTASVALLAVLHVSDFVDMLSGNSSGDRAPSPTRAARQITGFWAFIAILAILAHVLAKDVGGTVSSTAEAATEAAAEEAPDEATADGKAAVNLGQAMRDLVQFIAVMFTGASIGMWISIRWARGLLALPDPPVQPSTRLWSGAVDLLVPAVVVLILIRRFDYWFDTWDTSVIATSAVAASWQLLLTRASSAGGRHSLKARIVETMWAGEQLNAPPGRLRSAETREEAER